MTNQENDITLLQCRLLQPGKDNIYVISWYKDIQNLRRMYNIMTSIYYLNTRSTWFLTNTILGQTLTLLYCRFLLSDSLQPSSAPFITPCPRRFRYPHPEFDQHLLPARRRLGRGWRAGRPWAASLPVGLAGCSWWGECFSSRPPGNQPYAHMRPPAGSHLGWCQTSPEGRTNGSDSDKDNGDMVRWCVLLQ